MGKIIWLFIAVGLLSGCNVTEKKILKKEMSDDVTYSEFGPLVLPENHQLNAVSLHYFTKEPETTSVYFSMVGDVDWMRNDKELTRCHKMVFDQLEENAVYQFNVNHPSKVLNQRNTIKTVPFGNEYSFSFQIATMSEKLETEHSPNFLVLMSEKPKVDEKTFKEYYDKNRKALSSTILLPLFEFTVSGKQYSISPSGFYFSRYKSVNLICVYKPMPDYDFIAKYLSISPDDKNYIVLGNIGEDKVIEVSRKYNGLVDRIFTLPYANAKLQNVSFMGKSEVVTVVRKAKYAFK